MCQYAETDLTEMRGDGVKENSSYMSMVEPEELKAKDNSADSPGHTWTVSILPLLVSTPIHETNTKATSRWRSTSVGLPVDSEHTIVVASGSSARNHRCQCFISVC